MTLFPWPAADFSSRRFANLTEDLREIKAGKEHLLALTANGQVFIPAAFVVFARSSKLAGLLRPSQRPPKRPENQSRKLFCRFLFGAD